MTAKEAVDTVDSPNSLQASKDATDIIVSGLGVSATPLRPLLLTRLRLGDDDAATGVVGSDATYTNVDSFSIRILLTATP